MVAKLKFFIALPLLSILMIGCQKGNPNAPASVNGKVTYKGTMVTAGIVVFHTKESGAYTAPINKDGTFSTADLPVGECIVTVDTEVANPDAKQPDYKGAKGGPQGMYGKAGGGGASSGGMPAFKGKSQASPMPEGAGSDAGAYVKIPLKYKDREKSGLKTTLAAGKNEYNISLED